MSEKNNKTFTQASLLAREEKVLQDAEIVITTQRNRIGELRSELERLNAEKVYWSNTHMKEMSDVIQENTKLRLQLDEMQSDLNALRHTQDSTDNLITNLTEALGTAESQLLSQDNELKKLRSLAGNLPRENNELREENQRLLVENERLKRMQEENRRYLETNKLSKNGISESDNNAIQAVNDSLKKHAKLARDLDFKTEELRVNKMCLLQLESDLLEHQLLVEQQRVEIQRLNTAVEALNREKSLIPPVVITNCQLDSSCNENEANDRHKNSSGMTPKDISDQIIAEITKVFPKLGNKLDKEDQIDTNGGMENDIDIVQYRTMEEQRILISRLLKGLDQLGFTRSEATCYKERASDYRWFYSAMICHSVTYNTKNSELAENGDKNSSTSPPGFFNLFVRVESGNLSIFQNVDEEVPIFSIKPWKSNIEIFEKNRQFLITRVSTTSDQIESHIFYCQTEDEFNRWFYALCYGGFIKSSECNMNNALNNEYNVSNVRNDSNNYFTTIKIYDLNDISSYKLVQISINNDMLVFNNGINSINTRNSKLKVDLKKEQMIIDYMSNNNQKTIVFSSYDFDDLKNALMKCKWFESKIIANDNISSINRESNDYKINIGNNNKSNITSKQKFGKELVPQSINFSVNNNNNDVSKAHGIIMVENNQVLLYHNESDINEFTRINLEDCSVEHDRRKMSVLITKSKGNHVESFYYMFASLEEFNRSLARLREGGISECNNSDKTVAKQICVVCKNKIHFYKDYDDSVNSVAFLTLSPDDTNCHIDSDRNEIILIYSQSDSTRKKIILDCANIDEFMRWNIALSFGGFVNGVKRSSMSKYTFDISIFELIKENGREELRSIDKSENRSIYKDFYNITDYQSIEIYNTEENKKLNKPLIVIPFKDTEYICDAKKRQIIFLTRRGKAGEVRVIFNLQTLSNFDVMNKDLINVDFPVLESSNAATSSKAEYIIGAKNGILCVYCTSKNKDYNKESNKDVGKLGGGIKHAMNENKYLNKGGVGLGGNGSNYNHDSNARKFPECGYIKYSVSDFICVVSRAGRSVALRRKEDDYDALSVRCKSLTEYEKWERSMSIAGFINNESMNNNSNYLPPITYLFHSLDYDFRKQPILPTLLRDKTMLDSSAGVTNSEINKSDYSSLDEPENNNTANKKSFNQQLVPPKNKKSLDSTSIHRQTPPLYSKMGVDDETYNHNYWDNINKISRVYDNQTENDKIDYFSSYMNEINGENEFNNKIIINEINVDDNHFVEFNIINKSKNGVDDLFKDENSGDNNNKEHYKLCVKENMSRGGHGERGEDKKGEYEKYGEKNEGESGEYEEEEEEEYEDEDEEEYEDQEGYEKYEEEEEDEYEDEEEYEDQEGYEKYEEEEEEEYEDYEGYEKYEEDEYEQYEEENEGESGEYENCHDRENIRNSRNLSVNENISKNRNMRKNNNVSECLGNKGKISRMKEKISKRKYQLREIIWKIRDKGRISR